MIYVMADIHGNMRRFQSILSQINLQPDDTLYILGDVIDRHPDGIRILRKIMASPNMQMLLGNHEYMMLRALGIPFDESDWDTAYDPSDCLYVWYRNGGGVTHRHLMHIRKQLRSEIFSFLKALPLNIDITVNGKNYKLVHGAPVDQFDSYSGEYRSLTHFAVWHRWKKDAWLPDQYTMIFGHTPTRHFQNAKPMKIFHGDNRIGVDCGCGYSADPSEEHHDYGRLSCLRLDDMQEFYSEETYPDSQ